MKNITRQKNPDYDKIRYQKNKELKNKQSREWAKNNPKRVKELYEHHHRLRKEKLIESRKKLLDYDNHTWYRIEDTEYFINEEFVIINKNFKILKITTNNIGYQIVAINGKSFMYHRIIASVFIPNPENKKEINHINGIKSDNRIENLEWSTRSENVKHSFDVLGKKSNLIGWREKKAKTLNNSKVDDI